MRALRKPRIGLAGMMCTPFRGDKDTRFRTHRAALETLADRLGFDLHAVEAGIYTQEQSVAAARELHDWGADFIVLQASSFAAGSFIYPFVELRCRLGVWAVPEGAPTSEGGLPLNSFTSANMYNSILRTQRTGYGQPVKWFWGDPGQPLFDARLETTVRALRALVNLHGARIGLIGGVAPGFDNLVVDEGKLKARLGVDLIEVELDDLLRRTRAADASRASQVAAEIRESATAFDESQVEALGKSGRVSLALQELAEAHDLQALAVSCWPRFQSDYGLAVCTVMGHLNTSGLIAACEGDAASAVTMLALRFLTQGDVTTLMDLATLDPDDESILLWHCGPTSPALADARGARMGSLWLFDGPDGKRTGLHNDLVLRPGAVTVAGFTVDFDRMLVLDGVVDNTKPGYAGSGAWLRSLRMNAQPVSVAELVQTLMASGFQHHYPLAYGHLSEPITELCRWIGIQPIQVQPLTTSVL